jgi:uncharacterized OsmC-like protein
MAKPFKFIFIANQNALREHPAQGQIDVTVSTRQVARLTSEAAIRDFRLRVDQPPQFGGRDQAPTPPELVLAALGACQEMAYRLYADTLEIPLDGVSVELEGRLDLRGLLAADEGVRPGFRAIKATVILDSPASPDDLERLRATVERHCPVLDMLRHVTPVKTELTRANTSAA